MFTLSLLLTFEVWSTITEAVHQCVTVNNLEPAAPLLVGDGLEGGVIRRATVGLAALRPPGDGTGRERSWEGYCTGKDGTNRIVPVRRHRSTEPIAQLGNEISIENPQYGSTDERRCVSCCCILLFCVPIRLSIPFQ